MLGLSQWDTVADMTKFVNREKASSHPLAPGGLYVGVVKSMLSDGRVNVFVPRLNSHYGPLRIAGQSAITRIEPEQQVVLAFMNSGTSEIIVIADLDINPKIIKSTLDEDDTPVEIYRHPIQGNSATKLCLLLENETIGKLYEELVILIVGGTPYVKRMQYDEETTISVHGRLTFDAVLSDGHVVVSCEANNAGTYPYSLTTTRLISL